MFNDKVKGGIFLLILAFICLVISETWSIVFMVVLTIAGLSQMYSGYSEEKRHRYEKLICSACGQIGRPVEKYKGSIAIEIVLWLFFLIPGLIYSIWRGSNKLKTCPKCNSKDSMIPADSPKGIELTEKYEAYRS